MSGDVVVSVEKIEKREKRVKKEKKKNKAKSQDGPVPPATEGVYFLYYEVGDLAYGERWW